MLTLRLKPKNGVIAASGSTVLHVLDHSWPVLSGYAVRSRNLITAQHRLGQPIVAVTGPLHQMDDDDATDVTLDGVQYLRTPIKSRIGLAALRGRWPVARERETMRLLRDRILEVIDRHSVRIVYAHSPALCGLPALQAARKRKLPFIYEIRAFWEDAAADQNRATPTSLRSRLTRKLETYVAERADAVAAIAKPMLHDLESRGIAPDKLFHVPNGVDLERFQPTPRDRQLASELRLGERPTLGFFGSLYRYEGVSWMIRAAARLRARGHRFNILIVGRGEDRKAIDDAITDCDASDYVRLLDHVPHEEIGRYYSVVDIAVYPRRSIRLTELVTPLKPLEAMALNKAVLASSVGGIRELVGHERTGLLFQPEDENDFAAQAERLLASPSLRRTLGENGREFVARERSWEMLAQQYERIYEFVLERQPSPARQTAAR
ncbi:MAG TPA: glycosyltransferase [Candidatus Binatia bacterium]|nr:glycosyltransferase [Candidatus Binatia bacterium]